MRDEEILKDLLDIAHGLDNLGKELIRLARVTQIVIGELPIPVEVWDKVVVREWDNNVAG